MKGEDGIPVPDMQEGKVNLDGHEMVVHNYEGLTMGLELAAQGETDKEIAVTLNQKGYRTTGTHGSRPFSKDTIKAILTNRFYIGYIPDGNAGWVKAKHETFIEPEIFEEVQKKRQKREHPRNTININARTYSLSTLMWCNKCKSKMRVQMTSKGRPRIYCAGRAKGDTECDCKGTFVDVYEAQIEWYLEHFEIPSDWRETFLESYTSLRKAYRDIESESKGLQLRLARLKELYE
ncbi:MAG: recombinase family protein, partial [Dehalococcoidia bacterium]|nr:recombinase family protein [Dehalococcoidia bacterium]